MKYTITKIKDGEDELILKYQCITPEVERLMKFISRKQIRLLGYNEKNKVLLEHNSILYIESVDGKVFAYTDDEVYRFDYILSQVEQILADINFFRCSKAMIINIDKVKILKSLPSNRIDATMCNGEHVMISRTYASNFRKRLRGEDCDES